MTIKYNVTPRMQELSDAIEPLDLEYESLRDIVPGYPYENPIRDKMRLVRKKLSALEREFWDISLQINAEWHAQEPLWKKKFT